MKKILCGIALGALTVSCTSVARPVKTVDQPLLTGTEWQLADNVKGQRPTMSIEGDKINGNAGCNKYFGSLSLSPAQGVFTAHNIGSTRMSCKEMETEQNFLALLPQANKYRVSGNTLELYKNNLLLLKFNKR